MELVIARPARLAGPVILAVALCGLVLGATSCSSDDPAERVVTVYAASSLTASFTEIGARFEASNPGVTVRFNFGGSSGLAVQIQEGAPADVFASADEFAMAGLTGDGFVNGDPTTFATNMLEIAVPPGNPAGVESLRDLAASGINLVTCAPAVPCGAAATRAAAAAGVRLSPVSEEQSVADVLAKVRSGEADAGLVYVTDVLGAGDGVVGIDFPEAREAVNTYPIAVLADSSHTELAQAFEDFVLFEGLDVLADAGFGPP